MSEPPHRTPPQTDALWPVLYDELRQLATKYLRDRPAGHSLQPTIVVNEAYVKLGDRPAVRDAEHFKALAATAMRQIVVDYVRERHAQKRGGDWARVTLDAVVAEFQAKALDALALDEALTRLAAESERHAKVVELRLFGGLTVEEAARVLSVGQTTVKADWRFATAWLKRELDPAR